MKWHSSGSTSSGSFAAWLNFKEKEVRNMKWIADMIVLGRRVGACADLSSACERPALQLSSI